MPSHYSPSDSEWLRYKNAIRDLYIDQNRTLNDLMIEMDITYKFKASKYKYTSMLESWGFRKNLKREHYQIIDQSEGRAFQELDDTYEFRGRQVPVKKLKRGFARYNRATSKDMMPGEASPSGLVAKTFASTLPTSKRSAYRMSMLPCIECYRIIFSVKHGTGAASKTTCRPRQPRRQTTNRICSDSPNNYQLTLHQRGSSLMHDVPMAGQQTELGKDLDATMYACLIPPMLEKDRRRRWTLRAQLEHWLKSRIPITSDFSSASLTAQLFSEDLKTKAMTFVFLTIHMWQNQLLDFDRFDVFMEWAVKNEIVMSILHRLISSSWSYANELERSLIHGAIRIQKPEAFPDLVSNGVELIDQPRIYEPEHDISTITNEELYGLDAVAIEHLGSMQFVLPSANKRQHNQPFDIFARAFQGGAPSNALEGSFASSADVDVTMHNPNAARAAVSPATGKRQAEELGFLQLKSAVKDGLEQRVFQLLHRGVNPNNRNIYRSETSLLDDAILTKNARVVQALLDWGVYITSCSLRHAISMESPDMITMILKGDVSQLSPDTDVPWEKIANSDTGRMIYRLLKTSNVWKTGEPSTQNFNWVFESDSMDFWVEALVELDSERIFGQGAHVRLFWLALKYGFLDVAKKVVFHRPNHDHWLDMASALRLATKRSDYDTLSWLISLGPDPNLPSYGYVALQDAAEMGSLGNMSIFFEHGIRILSEGILHQLVEFLWRLGRLDAMVMLLEHTDSEMVLRMISVWKRSQSELHRRQLAEFLVDHFPTEDSDNT